MRTHRTLNAGITTSIFTLLVAAAAVRAEAPYEIAWVQQLGPSSEDRSRSVSVDKTGSVFISGRTYGSLGGANAGGLDAFLTKYDSAGNWQWSQQLGTSNNDTSFSVAVDAAGNAYISGGTEGDLDGANAGGHDAFLAKYDSGGNWQWSRQLGTSSGDHSRYVAVDAAGNAFISGFTEGDLDGANAGGDDAFLAKYDSGGNWQWTRQLGTSSDDQSHSVAVDGAGNAFISGWTEGALDGANAGAYDAFLVKYDTAGNLLWTEQLGTAAADRSWFVAVDGTGNAYISGRTDGSLGGASAGDNDTFLAKYDSAGTWQWTRQLGTSSDDHSLSVAVDGAGNAFISGETYGDLSGANAGNSDAFLAKYDTAGNLLWTEQLGTAGDDYSHSVGIDRAGNVFLTGSTTGSLGGSNAGGYDAFLVKYEVPEPATLSLLALGAVAILRRRSR